MFEQYETLTEEGNYLQAREIVLSLNEKLKKFVLLY